MPELQEYLSFAKTAEAEIEIKKSRFIGLAAPVASEDEAKALLTAVRERHAGARHNTYAYRVGLGTAVERASDDGEPGGTAGRPLLEILTRREVRNGILIVTRYFGGILLGAGGLLRAYSGAGVAAAEAAGMTRYSERRRLAITVDYPLWGKLEHEFGRRGLTVVGVEYAAQVTARILVPSDGVPGLTATVRDLSAGAAGVVDEGGQFVAG